MGGAKATDPFTVPIELRVQQLTKRVLDVENRIGEVARSVPTPISLRPVLLDIYRDECGRLEQLRDDAVRILTLLVEKGVVTQEELNAAVTRE